MTSKLHSIFLNFKIANNFQFKISNTLLDNYFRLENIFIKVKIICVITE